MRKTTVALYVVSTAALVGCGSGTKFANKPRPATPVNLTVYINNQRVSVSPASVGAGPVVFIVTNQANKSESLTIKAAGGGGAPLANTGPINPRGTAQVTVDFNSGLYTVTTAKTGATDAALAGASRITPAILHIGPPRPSAQQRAAPALASRAASAAVAARRDPSAGTTIVTCVILACVQVSTSPRHSHSHSRARPTRRSPPSPTPWRPTSTR